MTMERNASSFLNIPQNDFINMKQEVYTLQKKTHYNRERRYKYMLEINNFHLINVDILTQLDLLHGFNMLSRCSFKSMLLSKASDKLSRSY